MQKIITTLALFAVLAGTAWAQPPAAANDKPVSKNDTVLVQVYKGGGTNQIVLEVSLTNADSLAGMVVPLSATVPGVKMSYDSTSFAGTRIEYFQLKTDHQPDSTKPAVLLGLIADMSGSNPPLPPGRGTVAKIYFTGDGAVDLAKVKVQKIQVPPANQLDYTTPKLVTIRPTLVTRTGKPAGEMGDMKHEGKEKK